MVNFVLLALPLSLKETRVFNKAQKFPTTSLSFYDRASSTYSSPRNVQDVCHMNLV